MNKEANIPGPEQIAPPVPFDVELAKVLAPLGELAPASITPEVFHAMRAHAIPGPTNKDLEREGRFSVQNLTIAATDQSPELSVLICRPASAAGPLPAVYFVHGGGMILGTNRDGIQEMLDWAEELELVVVSVEYRLAPEHPYPAGVNDCYSGLVWTAENATALGIDSDRIIIAGASGGGGLAASIALMARDRGGPTILGQVLICPMLDDRNNSASAIQMTGIGMWDRVSNNTAWSFVLGDDHGKPGVSPYAAAARASDLSQLPPAFIDVGSAETFREEDIEYARRIWAAGGEAELHVWQGGFHGYALFAPQIDVSKETLQTRVRWLRRLLRQRASVTAK
ncbi:alpha/beta hydrolase [Arthrobacter sp. NPDC058097]|uniref:alpha/beta hydrolase n=1 Tax=Arthrobacter sp. NPDC058097 TaxID=3346340 RepID=UPI0036D7B3FB